MSTATSSMTALLLPVRLSTRGDLQTLVLRCYNPFQAPDPIRPCAALFLLPRNEVYEFKGSEAGRVTSSPVIVIEAASPIIDSESEYAETDLGDEAGGSSAAEGSRDTRRTGLIGSTHGFVPPSYTLYSVSFYSVSGSGLPTSSSISTNSA